MRSVGYFLQYFYNIQTLNVRSGALHFFFVKMKVKQSLLQALKFAAMW